MLGENCVDTATASFTCQTKWNFMNATHFPCRVETVHSWRRLALCVGDTNCLPRSTPNLPSNPLDSNSETKKTICFYYLWSVTRRSTEFRPFFSFSRFWFVFRLQCEIWPFVAHVNRTWICCRSCRKYPFVAYNKQIRYFQWRDQTQYISTNADFFQLDIFRCCCWFLFCSTGTRTWVKIIKIHVQRGRSTNFAAKYEKFLVFSAARTPAGNITWDHIVALIRSS